MPSTLNEDVRIYYEVAGTGPVLLLLHGVGSRGRQWQKLGYVERFAPHFTVVTVDQRGHGDSDRPDEVEAYAPARRMSDALAVLDAINATEAHVFGYSMGGRNAIRLAMEYPERVKSLVLGACNPYETSMNGPLTAPLRRWTWSRIRRGFFRKVWGRLSPNRVSRFVGPRIRASAEAVDLDAAIEQLRMPTLVFIGAFDQTFDVGLTREFAEQLADARFEVVPDAEHSLIHHPQQVLPLVEPFLQEQIATSS